MVTLILALFAFVASVSAYSFEFANTPTQCGNLTVNIIDGQGKPPYALTIVAAGNAPAGNEIRKIIYETFSSTSHSFPLVWPANAAFIAMVSDASGIGSGGTSIETNAASSNDATCLPPAGSIDAKFFIFVNDVMANVIQECEPVRLEWSNTSTGTVTLWGIVPGGDSFAIDTTNPTTGQDGHMGVTWTPDVPQFTDIIIMANDATGNGTGGSSSVINVSAGDKGCLQPDSPSSTPGVPAGAIETGSGGGGGSSDKVAPIVGGVIGGLAFIILVLLAVLFVLIRRRRRQRHSVVVQKPDLADGEPDLPRGTVQQLEPTPFLVPPSARGSHYDVSSTSASGADQPVDPAGARPYSMVSSSAARTSTDVYSNDPRERKTGLPPAMRPVNVIQHADAGAAPLDHDEEEPDTVELPPAYGALRRGASTAQRPMAT